MKLILRVSLFMAGMLLIGMATGGDKLRREPSTAYWVLGRINGSDNRGFYLISPNGRVRQTLIRAQKPYDMLALDWLPDERTLLYTSQTSDGREEVRRYSLKTRTSTVLSPNFMHYLAYEARVNPIPKRSDYSIMLYPDQAAIFAINAHGELLRRLTPFHDRIVSLATWSPDGEWLYYIAEDREDVASELPRNLPQVLYRQRYDGSEHIAMMQVDVEIGLFLFSTSTSIFVTQRSRAEEDHETSLPIYRIRPETGELSKITPEEGRFSIGLSTTDWLIVTQRSINDEITDVYRLSANGDHFVPLIEEVPPADTIRLIRILEPHFLVFSHQRSGQLGLYQINIETQEQDLLIGVGQFFRFDTFRLTGDGENLIFTGQTINCDYCYYRFNLKTWHLQPLMAEHMAAYAEDEWFSSQMMAVYQEYALIMENEQIGPDYLQSLYRLNIETDHLDLLHADIGFGGGGVQLSPPTNGREVVLLMGREDGQSANIRIDLETGNIVRLSQDYGVLFSPLIDADWQFPPIFMAGLGLISFGLVWSFIEFRRVGRD